MKEMCYMAVSLSGKEYLADKATGGQNALIWADSAENTASKN